MDFWETLLPSRASAYGDLYNTVKLDKFKIKGTGCECVWTTALC